MAAVETPPELPGLTYISVLGSGGYSRVYLYEQAITNMRVAVKVLSGEDISDDLRRRFVAEANAMAQLADHPNIVQVFQADVTAENRPYFVMKYYPNQNLLERVRREQLSVPEVLSIGVQVSCAVATAHSVGILHCDIKPANILTGQYGEPGLTDFGIATNLADNASSGSSDGGMSIPWAPPEVIFSSSDPDERSDIYSLAASLWHLLARHAPFEEVQGDNSTLALMRRTREKQVATTGRPDVPVSLERLLAQALSKSPANRPSSALLFARALQGVEIEQRWPPTPLRVPIGLDGGSSPAHTDPSNSDQADSLDERTSLRAPKQVSAQASPSVSAQKFAPVEDDEDDRTEQRPRVAPTSQPAAPAPPPNTPRPRVGLPSDRDASSTIQRARVAGTSTAEPTDVEPPSPSSRKRLVALVVGAAVILIAVVAILLSSMGHTPPARSHDSQTSGSNNQSAAVGQGVTPGTPTVTGTLLSPTDAQFTWTYANEASGDSYEWQTADGSTSWQPVPKARVTIPIAAGQSECIVVKVASAQGLISPTSSPGCVN